jgi:flagellar hook-basal body complex protein FliE
MMDLQSLYGPSGLPQVSPSITPPIVARESGRSSGEMPFADMVKDLVQQTDRQQIQAEQEVQKLVTGETDSIHDVVLTTSKADLAFRLMMEIRNRLIASYQEIMRMQI